MKPIETVMSVLLLIGICCYGTYVATSHYVYQQAYNNGHSIGYGDGYSKGRTAGIDSANAANNNFGLFDKTSNQATAPAPTYVAPASPTHCSSYTYGTSSQFTDVNCN